MGTKNFFIALYNKESDTISLPLFIDERGHFESFPGGKTLTSYVLRNNKPLLVTAEDIDKMVASGEVEIVGARSKVWLGAPLEAGDKVVGALVAQDYTDEAAFGEKDLELLKFISSQIGLSIEHKRSAEALKESEERYRTLFENAPIGIGLATLDGRILDGNDNMFKLTGYSREELKQKALIDTYQDPEKHDELFERLQKEGLVRDFEADLKRKDGIIYHASITITMFSLGGKDFILTMIEDITERKRLEEELLKAQKLDSIGVLAGGIAHDFNNILTAIIGNITLAKMDTKSGDEIFEVLTEAEKASGRAKDLTQQLLTFSKGRTPVKKTSSIAELTKDSAGFILRGFNVKCKFFIPDDLWPVEVDEGQMSQVINNLLINAAQAMPEGGIIEVQAENIHVGSDYLPHLKDEKYIKFSIKDHGIGISEEYLPKIFDPYFTTKQEGSGLGLATCYAIVKNHAGYLFVESELEVGTTFSIYLPACLKEIPAKQKMEEKPLTGGGKILIMDDEEMVRKTAGRILKSIGYEVVFAQDGAEAIELYKKAMQTERPFDAVIIDLTVPGGMGAKESIKKLLEIDPGVKAIVSSGYSNDPVMANCREYGFYAAILKPYKLKELSEILQGVITTSGLPHGRPSQTST
ncbi:Sensor histidine kinase RcsC [subsurface metagenome]